MAFVEAFLLWQPKVFRLRWELGIRFSNMFARYFWTQGGAGCALRVCFEVCLYKRAPLLLLSAVHEYQLLLALPPSLPPRLSNLTSRPINHPAPILLPVQLPALLPSSPTPVCLATHARIHTSRPTHEPPAASTQHPDRQKAVGGVRASPARPHSRTPGLSGLHAKASVPRSNAYVRQKGEKGPRPSSSSPHMFGRMLFSSAASPVPARPRREQGTHIVRFASLPPSRIARRAPEVRPTCVRPGAAGRLGWQNPFLKKIF